MSDQPQTKAALLPEIGRTWAALNTTLGRLTENQMLHVYDSQGWNVKDHLIHLIVGKTVHYFTDHLEWIEALAGSK